MHKQDNFILFSNLMIFLSYPVSYIILSSIPFSKRGGEGEGLNALAGQFRSLPLLAAL